MRSEKGLPMKQSRQDTIGRTLAQRCLQLSAGCDVDYDAVQRWNVDLSSLRKLSEAYRMGWLHNVMGRITPLTVRKRDDYLAMADIFIDTQEAAQRLLDKFKADMELFCQLAGIRITGHMTAQTVSEELKAHVELYDTVAQLLCSKFDMSYDDPVQAIANSPIEDACNPFVSDYMDSRFPQRVAVEN
jgi:hypothetical protein